MKDKGRGQDEGVRGSAGLNIFMFIRDFLNKLYKSCVQCSTCCVAVMLPDAHV